MICPNCKANMQKVNGTGDQMLRTRGLVLRKSSITAICPKCSGDVLLSQTAMQELHEIAVLFFQRG